MTFTSKGPQVTQGGHMITALTMSLEDEHRLFETPGTPSANLDDWLKRFPGAWAETAGMGLAKQQPPIVVELKATSVSVAVRQYPMSREA